MADRLSSTRRRVLKVTGGVGATGLAGCLGSITGDGETPLRVYDQEAGDDRDPEPYREALTRFEDEHDTTVEVIGQDGDNVVEKYRVEYNNDVETADVVAGWITKELKKAQRDGILERPELPELFENIPDRFHEDVLIRHAGVHVPAYNPDELEDQGIEPPESYADLQDDRFADQLAVVDPLTYASGEKTVAYIVHDLGYGWDYYRELATNGASITALAQVPEEIMNPDSDIAVGIMGLGRGFPEQQDGEPIQMVIPEEGALGSGHGVTVNPDSSHPELALDFVREVKFDTDVLDVWANRYLPIADTTHELPDDSPLTIQDVDKADLGWMIDNELDIRVEWENVF